MIAVSLGHRWMHSVGDGAFELGSQAQARALGGDDGLPIWS